MAKTSLSWDLIFPIIQTHSWLNFLFLAPKSDSTSKQKYSFPESVLSQGQKGIHKRYVENVPINICPPTYLQFCFFIEFVCLSVSIFYTHAFLPLFPHNSIFNQFICGLDSERMKIQLMEDELLNHEMQYKISGIKRISPHYFKVILSYPAVTFSF